VPTPEQIRAAIARYVEAFPADRDGWVACFAEDATVEDPVGTEVRKGHAEIGEFWDFAHGLADSISMTPTGPVRVAAGQAAWPFQINTVIAGTAMVMDVIDVMTFDDEARITSMRAFWDMNEMRPAAAD
jgi:steroid Delta-isomerase